MTYYAVHHGRGSVEIVLKEVLSAFVDAVFNGDGAGISALYVSIGKVAAFGRGVAEIISLCHVRAVLLGNALEGVVPSDRGKAVLLPFFVDEVVDALFERGKVELRLFFPTRERGLFAGRVRRFL